MTKQRALSPEIIAAALTEPRTPGRVRKLTDGQGLYLLITHEGAYWRLKYYVNGAERTHTIGSLRRIDLVQARQAAKEARARNVLRQPLRPGMPVAAAPALTSAPTFREVAEAWHQSMLSKWIPKTGRDTKSRLERFVYPKNGFGDALISELDKPDVKKVCMAIPKRITAGKALQDIVSVFAYASGEIHGFPAKHVGMKEAVLPGLAKKAKTEHRAALEQEQMQPFVSALNALPDSVPKLALLWTIHTCARTKETLGARREQIVTDNGMTLWVVPAELMKARVEHRVPLTAHALAILERCPPTDKLFPKLDHNSMLEVLKQLGVEATVHGMRSVFRDWAAEHGISHDVSELCLAHTRKDKTEAAYLRTAMLKQRLEALKQWSTHIEKGK